ncbi:Gfo/Idh/MocA family protein [Marinactinospora thermotolerans]|uniref:Predicted dehydrogenase n=1 Tax=Marinactinospora thermotolerans DSM 45154 TaxID=1122192 RepID=A0A1T4PP70_9ACTN|nr:Gfo/Idh/MocA family oxidoreductase [Marinactinospora thermotolerans]SJZ93007.1 Predicted dehydrogenase [Marinactinospora thermotolerans DSM 45154]
MTSGSSKVRWGILGTGAIAERFLHGLRAVPDAEAVAVGSRDQSTADRFADRWDIPRRHGSYQALAEDDDVDVVYVATPHSAHHDATVMCLEAGRGVLCEKPLALDAAQAGAMVETARRNGRFLMEGMWTRFAPAMIEAVRLVGSGAIGRVRTLTADIGWRADYDPASRLFSPALGGGALLDLGVYPVALASAFLGEPAGIDARAEFAPTGVDSQVAITLTGNGGEVALLLASIETDLPARAVISGTEGRIEIEEWFNPTSLTLVPRGGEPRVLSFPRRANGFEYEAAAVTELVRAGAQESPRMPWAESLRVADVLDRIRSLTG